MLDGSKLRAYFFDMRLSDPGIATVNRLRFGMMTFAIFLFSSICLNAQVISWKGHQWNVTAGGMAGVAKGNPANVFVEKDGSLRLGIVNRAGTWTGAEMFTVDALGFGTYQWVVQGDIYKMDKSTVLGLFTYGPAHHVGVDGENEIDIEFSQWNNTCHGCNADFTVYPSTGNRTKDGVSNWEDNFYITGEALTTARMLWQTDHIVFTIMRGVQPIGETANVIRTETYASNSKDIPQVAVPVGINLWSFQGTPSKDQSVVIQDFQFVGQ